MWDLRDSSEAAREGNILEDMSIPGAFAPIVFSLLPMASAAFGEDTNPGNYVEKYLRILSSLVDGPYTGSSHNTLMVSLLEFFSCNISSLEEWVLIIKMEQCKNQSLVKLTCHDTGP